MRHVLNKTSRKYFVIFVLAIVSAMVLLAYFGKQTVPMQSESQTHKESVSLETTTTSTVLVETTTTVPEITTTTEPVVEITVTTRVSRTTTTKPYMDTTLPETASGSDGPPRNTTTLVGCIAFYESTWGKDPNVFQFTQGTWEAYGGTGSPSNASYSHQEEIFWLAWEDAGHHHWLAQKGRCF
jgi:hypothetical protein